MATVAGVIVFKAKTGQGDHAARLIAAALPAVEAETGTPFWLLLQSKADADTLFLVDLFHGEDSLDAHMKGDAARLIFATVPELLASEPEIHPSQVIARKGA